MGTIQRGAGKIHKKGVDIIQKEGVGKVHTKKGVGKIQKEGASEIQKKGVGKVHTKKGVGKIQKEGAGEILKEGVGVTPKEGEGSGMGKGMRGSKRKCSATPPPPDSLVCASKPRCQSRPCTVQKAWYNGRT